jgi:predicted Zn-dependent protease
MNREQARALVARIVKLSKADELWISVSGGATTHLRFARNNPTTSGSFTELSISVTSSFGKRSASTTVNQTDDATLERAVRRSEEIARLAPEDPEHMPALESAEYVAVDGFDEETERAGGERIASGAARCIAEAAEAKLVAAGFTDARAGFECLANSKGLFGYHRASGAYVGETVRTADGRGSGWASASSHAVGKLDYGGVSAAARDKAARSVGPKPLEPGKYVTILEPACVANLISNLIYSMDARDADEGRSFFSDPARRRDRLFPESVTIRSDPTDPRAPARPWGGEGLPQTPRAWIDKGRVASLVRSRFWASKQGEEPVPWPSNTIMSGGSGSVADLVASTERGVLVTSLWYVRSLDPRTLTYTGLTRDGVFWIEDGEIRHPVTNFRWNDSPIAVLKNTVAMSAAVRVPPRPSRSTTTIVPALKVSEFNLASVSDAV